MRTPNRLSSIHAVWISAAWLLLLLSATARAGSTTFAIEPQDLSGALKAFAVQSHREIFFSPELAVGRKSKGVKGTYEDLKALNIILEGTGLDFSITTSNAILVRDPANKGNTSSTDLLPNSAVRATQTAATETPSAGRDPPPPTSPAGAEGPALSEIIVTAQKRNERLQDVPVPVTVISAESLIATNQVRLQDYYTRIPGLAVTPDDLVGQAMVTIRGVTTGPYTNPTVGIVVDDIPYGASTGIAGGSAIPDIDPSDLAQIEVLRGPQGTLYGASSIGGLLKFVTVDPSTDALSGRVEAGTSSVYNGAELGYNMRGAVNVPLSDTAAVRASAFVRQDPGYIDDPVHHLNGTNWIEAYGGRVSALWRPSEDLSLKLSATLQDTTKHGSSEVDIESGLSGLQQNDAPNTGKYHLRVEVYNATLKAKLGIVDLTSISGYGINKNYSSFDLTPAFSGYTESQFGVTGTPSNQLNKTSKITQEFRLSAPAGDHLDWLLGAFYTHENSPNIQDVLAENFTSGEVVGSWLHQLIPSTFEEYAAFTDVTFHLTNQFDVQVGGRESENRQENSQTAQGPYETELLGLPSESFFSPEVKTRDDSFTYLVTPRFRFTPDLMAYARLASGYRPGGPNYNAVAFNLPPSFKPDKTQNYELGVKGDTLDHILTFDASLYRIDWKDIQVTVINPANYSSYTANGSRARSQGVELSLEAKPVVGLVLSSWIAWNDAKLTEPFPLGPPGSVAGAAGDRLPYSSRYSGNVAFEDSFLVGDPTQPFVGATVAYVGDREGVFNVTPPANPPRQEFPSYVQIDLRAGVRHDSWLVNTYVTNLADKRGLLTGGIGTLNPSAYYCERRLRTA
jgi:iron complex outermembrane receptor protein